MRGAGKTEMQENISLLKGVKMLGLAAPGAEGRAGWMPGCSYERLSRPVCNCAKPGFPPRAAAQIRSAPSDPALPAVTHTARGGCQGHAARTALPLLPKHPRCREGNSPCGTGTAPAQHQHRLREHTGA